MHINPLRLAVVVMLVEQYGDGDLTMLFGDLAFDRHPHMAMW